jgi:hypothetical protein
MAKIPVITSLNRQDFPEAPDWIVKLLYPLQLFMNTVLSAMRNQLTLQDNFSCVVKQFALTAGATDINNTFSFPANLGRTFVELNAYCTNADGSYIPVYPQVSWNYINGQVVINGIKGLTPTKTYNFIVTVK